MLETLIPKLGGFFVSSQRSEKFGAAKSARSDSDVYWFAVVYVLLLKKPNI